MDINYIRVGDYFIPDLTLPEENHPIGKWGRMHRDYLREHKPIQYNCLLLSGELWTYLADLNQQAQDRLERMIHQMKMAEGVAEELKDSMPRLRSGVEAHFACFLPHTFMIRRQPTLS